MPKKPPRNQFYFFMKSIEPDLRSQGHNIKNMDDLVTLASPLWKKMSHKEREPYEQLAKYYKNNAKTSLPKLDRMDNIGNIIAERRNPHKELEDRRMKEREEVKSKWPLGRDLVNEIFYFVHFNTFCTTEDKLCLPAEVSLVEYSMKDGISRTWHDFIDPGGIPLGYRFSCTDKSETTHQIPFEDFELANDNYAGILNIISEFINPDWKNKPYPPLYCKSVNIEDAELSFDFLGHYAGSRSLPFRIYELEGLIVDIYAHMDQNVSRGIVSDMLATTKYDYNADTLCEYHNEKDVKHCSLGITRRWAYTMSDNLSEVYQFEITADHLPDCSKVTDNITVINHSSRYDAFARSNTSSPSLHSAHSAPSFSSKASSAARYKFPARDIRYADGQCDEDESDRYSHVSINSRGSDRFSQMSINTKESDRFSRESINSSSKVPSEVGQPMRGISSSDSLSTRSTLSSSRSTPSWVQIASGQVGRLNSSDSDNSWRNTSGEFPFPPAPMFKSIPSIVQKSKDLKHPKGRGWLPNKF